MMEGRDGKFRLTAQQMQALESLLSRKSITETAEAVGVARETVSRWRNHDPGFMAAYNQASQNAWEVNQTKLVAARSKATDRLMALLDSEDEAMVLKVCAQIMGMKASRPGGETDPEKIQRQQEREARTNHLYG